MDQLKQLNNSFFDWKNQRRKTFYSKFTLALIFVFGLTLFSCDDDSKRVISNLNRTIVTEQQEAKIIYINSFLSSSTFNLVDFVECSDNTNLDSSEEFLLGELVVAQEEIVEEPVAIPDLTPFPEPEIMGALIPEDYYDAYLKDTVKIDKQQ